MNVRTTKLCSRLHLSTDDHLRDDGESPFQAKHAGHPLELSAHGCDRLQSLSEGYSRSRREIDGEREKEREGGRQVGREGGRGLKGLNVCESKGRKVKESKPRRRGGRKGWRGICHLPGT